MSASPPPPPAHRAALRRWTLLLLALAVGHHVGTVLAPLGAVGSQGRTEWADWGQLVLPWAVTAAAAGTAAALRPSPRLWTALGAALLAYVSGHGIHLSANSIASSGVTPDVVPGGRTTFFWDELFGHALWYGGMYAVLLVLLLVWDSAEYPTSYRTWLLQRRMLALALGVTLATNAVTGHTVWLAVPAATGILVVGARTRRGLARPSASRSAPAVDLFLAAMTTLVVLGCYGLAVMVFGWEFEHT